jgi:hypothetical protein
MKRSVEKMQQLESIISDGGSLEGLSQRLLEAFELKEADKSAEALRRIQDAIDELSSEPQELYQRICGLYFNLGRMKTTSGSKARTADRAPVDLERASYVWAFYERHGTVPLAEDWPLLNWMLEKQAKPPQE